MFKCFYPDHYVDSTYVIEFEKLYKKGYRGIIFDIDNTLVPHGASADERVKTLMSTLKKYGFKIIVVSNNKEPRVKSFANSLQIPYIFKADKPKKAGYLKAMEIMSTTKKNTLFVGDQLFTDVWGAKRVGLLNYLVKPIHKSEEMQIVFKRKLEKIVLYFYKREIKKNEK